MSGHIHTFFFFWPWYPMVCCVCFLVQITGFSEQDKNDQLLYKINKDRKGTITCMTFKT